MSRGFAPPAVRRVDKPDRFIAAPRKAHHFQAASAYTVETFCGSFVGKLAVGSECEFSRNVHGGRGIEFRIWVARCLGLVCSAVAVM